MSVTFTLGGRRITADTYFGTTQLPGGDIRQGDIPPQIYDAAEPAALNSMEAREGGAWLVVWDGNTRVVGPGRAPKVDGRVDGGEARLGILNYSERPRRSFKVEVPPSGGWQTWVDGETVETGEFRPHTIWWESAASQSGFDFGFGGSGGWL